MTCAAVVTTFLFLWINLHLAANHAFAPAADDTARKVGTLNKLPVLEINGTTISRRVLSHILTFTAATFALLYGLSSGDGGDS